MLSKEKNPFIDVRQSEPDYDAPMPSTGKRKMKMRGPELTVRDVKLNIDESDFSKTMTAEIKFVPRMIRVRPEDGKVKRTYELEVVSLRIV